MLKSPKFWVGVAVSAVLLGLFFWKIDLRKTAGALRSANYWWFVPALAMYFIAVWFRTLRWHVLLRPMKSVGVARLYPVVVVGYMANNLLPLRAGELVRSLFVSRREGVSATAALATIIVERVLDGIVLIAIALIVWPFLPLPDLLRSFSGDTGIPLALLLALVIGPFVTVLALFLGIALWPALGRALTRMLVALMPARLKRPVQGLALRFVEGISTLRSPRRLAATLACSFPIWIAEGTMYYLVAIAFKLEQPFHALLITTSTSNLVTSVPSSAGGVGPFEYGARLTLEGLGVGTDVAAAYAIALHVALLAPVTLLGLFYVWQYNLSLGEMLRQKPAEPLAPKPAETVRP